MRSSIPARPTSVPGDRLSAPPKRSGLFQIGVANASLSVERVTRGQVRVGDGDTIVDIGVNCDPATLRRIRRLRIAMVGIAR